MIHGIGTDIVRVQRIADALVRYGERFAQRILTEQEWVDYRQTTRSAPFLAKRFAAKEAAVKALGTGFRDGLSLRDIGVVHDPLGRPLLDFSPRVRERLVQFGVGPAHLSIADEVDYAVAFVTLERLS